jgi:hypothetical protein
MLPQNAAALVGAGVLSVLVFPGVAVALDRRFRRAPVQGPADVPQQRATGEDRRKTPGD